MQQSPERWSCAAFARRSPRGNRAARLVGGLVGDHLRNDKGVVIVLQDPKAGMEFAANISAITISLKMRSI